MTRHPFRRHTTKAPTSVSTPFILPNPIRGGNCRLCRTHPFIRFASGGTPRPVDEHKLPCYKARHLGLVAGYRAILSTVQGSPTRNGDYHSIRADYSGIKRTNRPAT